ncbi:MAG: hypothetical protein JW958_11880 [Candidatus Eisenbacteria bacterium]|nr:hypothetical protein [Candidatus Eisenbacteria bacterium]
MRRNPCFLAALFALLFLPRAGFPAAVEKEPRSALPAGIQLDQVRDAGILWGGGYYLMVRSDVYTRHVPVAGFPVSDRSETLSGRLFFSYGFLGGRGDLSLAIDAYGTRFTPESAEGRETPPSESTGDVGDSRLGVRFALPTPAEALSASIEGFTTLETGNPDKSFSTHSNDGGVILALTWRGEGFRTHLQTGYRWNRNEEEGALLYPLFYPALDEGEGATANDALLLRGAVEFLGGPVDVFMELFADRHPWTRRLGPFEAPLLLTPGVRLHLRRGLFLAATTEIELAREDREAGDVWDPDTLFPDWRFGLALHWLGVTGGEDADDDGIEDAYDRCPRAPEDYDGYRDDDGCPDPDNDRDGVPDDWDKAPYDPEDFDGFEDEDGAPDLDNDQDGIPDMEDYCPDEPEDIDGDRDDDGCPDAPAAEGPIEGFESGRKTE